MTCPQVKKLLEAVCVLLQPLAQPTWAKARKLLGDPTLLQKLRDFNHHSAPPPHSLTWGCSHTSALCCHGRCRTSSSARHHHMTCLGWLAGWLAGF
jgi:hypothetical protein